MPAQIHWFAAPSAVSPYRTHLACFEGKLAIHRGLGCDKEALSHLHSGLISIILSRITERKSSRTHSGATTQAMERVQAGVDYQRQPELGNSAHLLCSTALHHLFRHICCELCFNLHTSSRNKEGD